MTPSSISDEEINRFLDDELSPAQRADLQSRLALEPMRAAEVFAEAQRMEALRSAQPKRPFPPQASSRRPSSWRMLFDDGACLAR